MLFEHGISQSQLVLQAAHNGHETGDRKREEDSSEPVERPGSASGNNLNLLKTVHNIIPSVQPLQDTVRRCVL